MTNRNPRCAGSRVRWDCTAFALLALVATLAAADSAPTPPAAPGGGPQVRLRTTEGDIVVELLPEAAPQPISQWLRLVQGPLFNPALADLAEGGRNLGYYDGLAFTFTQPHVEIVTAARAPEDLFQLAVELDAHALGLDSRRIANAGEAMDVFQQELFKAHGRMGKGDRRPPLLREWVERWEKSFTADFLVGESYQRVNEAQGYVYRAGLASQPVTRGAVTLRPLSPTRASMRLSIALADMPQRTGKWMVIGRVVAGLDLAEAISARAIKGQGTLLTKLFEPFDPVVITAVEVTVDPPPAITPALAANRQAGKETP